MGSPGDFFIQAKAETAAETAGPTGSRAPLLPEHRRGLLLLVSPDLISKQGDT